MVIGKSEHQGKGANVLGDPRIALTWIVNELSGLEIPLLACQVVATGTCVTPIAVVPGDEVKANLGRLGALSVRFSWCLGSKTCSRPAPEGATNCGESDAIKFVCSVPR
jgi:hypothetical protein